MSKELYRNLYLVKEHVGLFKAANNYDIHDPESGSMVLQCRENDLGIITKILRFTDFKRNTPFNIQITTPDGRQIVRVSRGISLLLSRVSVFDETDQYIGGFKQRFFSFGGAFNVLDRNDNKVCELNGKWTGWDFRFVNGQTEYAHVTKKWVGIGRELFSSADNYILQISDSVPRDDVSRKLILAAVMCIDMVLKE